MDTLTMWSIHSSVGLPGFSVLDSGTTTVSSFPSLCASIFLTVVSLVSLYGLEIEVEDGVGPSVARVPLNDPLIMFRE